MQETTISPKYQVVIPKPVRELVPIRAGQKVHIFARGETIVIVPDQPLESLRGFAGDLTPAPDLRDKKDRI
jgi:AbrB family looped-hinge helix DNA binding protein